MQELHTLNHSQLIELLAKFTSDYTKMISENRMGIDYEKTKMAIKAIQTEIEIRKNNAASLPEQTNIATPPDFS